MAAMASSAVGSMAETSRSSSSAAPASDATAPKTRENSGLLKASRRGSIHQSLSLDPLVHDEVPDVASERGSRPFTQRRIHRSGNVVALQVQEAGPATFGDSLLERIQGTEI